MISTRPGPATIAAVTLVALAFAALPPEPSRSQSATPAPQAPTPFAAPSAGATLAPPRHLPESGTAVPVTSPAASSPTPAPSLVVHGQVLAIARGFVIFTTGQALRLADDVRTPTHVPLGILARATIDAGTKRVVALSYQPRAPLAGEIDATQIPRDYLAASTESLPNVVPVGGDPLARTVVLTIDVRVPDNTPQLDDVYVATDRSNFGAAELRMQRVELRRWTTQISLKTGTTLRYEFTRGYNSTIERDRAGGLVDPRVVTVSAGTTTNDVVARWSDVQ